MKKYKSYIILIFIFAISIIGCAYALKWHSVYKENSLNKTIITDYIHEIKTAEFLNYISENPYTVIYFGTTNSSDCRRFENDFKDYIVKNNLREEIVYINVNTLIGDDFKVKFDKLFNTKELRNKNQYLYEVPAVAVYDHMTLTDFVSSSNLTINKVDKLLTKYKFVGA